MNRLEQKEIDRLVLAHAGLVRNIAKRYLPFGCQMADLVSEGNIGLLQAIRNFDSAKGASLATYAMIWIKSQINRYVMSNWSLVKIGANKEDRSRFYKESASFARDASLSHKNAFGLELEETLASSADLEREVADTECSKRFHAAMKGFLGIVSKRERDIFTRRRLKAEPDTLESLSLKYGVSKERVRQIENETFLKLKDYVVKSGL